MSERNQKTYGDIRAGKVENMREINIAFQLYQGLFQAWLQYPRMLQMEYGIFPFIAGGSIRDTILAKKVKDIDLWITIPDWIVEKAGVDRLTLLGEISGREGWTFSGVDNNDSGADPEGRGIIGVYEYQFDSVEQPYNIIVLNEDRPPMEIMREFDFGICQVGINPYGIGIVNKEFVEDVKNKTFTQTREQSPERKQERLRRLQQKFPDFKEPSVIVRPDGTSQDASPQIIVG